MQSAKRKMQNVVTALRFVDCLPLTREVAAIADGGRDSKYINLLPLSHLTVTAPLTRGAEKMHINRKRFGARVGQYLRCLPR